MAVKVPENSYLVNLRIGPGWQCDRGYRAIDEARVAIKVPENGYLADFCVRIWLAVRSRESSGR